LSANPGRLEGGAEVYEVTMESDKPRGWIRCYVPKEEGGDVIANGASFQRIDRVTPFLSADVAAKNHFESFNLPFCDTERLRCVILRDRSEMDLTQVQLVSIRKVGFSAVLSHGDYFQEVPNAVGYEMDFATPYGAVRYYSSLNGEVIIKESDVDRVVARPAEVSSTSPAGR
jgi:hypothetical protein